MRRIALALLLSSMALIAADTAEAEGRRMMIFAVYGPDGSTGSSTTTTIVDFTTLVACREARRAIQRDRSLATGGFRVIATCVEP